jgi:hypothetical protein
MLSFHMVISRFPYNITKSSGKTNYQDQETHDNGVVRR